MKKEEVLCPSGIKFVIRELTGDDDERVNAGLDESQMINTYVANGVAEGLTGAEDVKKLKLRDKYFLVLRIRMLSLGEKLYFGYQWPNIPELTEYEEDLSRYVWDYTKPFPKPGDSEYFKERIPIYPKQEFIEGELGGVKIRMDFMDGFGEEYLLKLPLNKRTVNQELVARNLRIFKDSEWKRVVNFSSFTARDMVFIRNLANEFDPPVEGLMDIENPITGEIINLPVIGVKDFFFPVKV